MAVGDVSASGGLSLTPLQDRVSGRRQQSGAQLSRSVNNFVTSAMGYAESRGRLEDAYKERAEKSQRLDVELRLLEYQRQRGEEYSLYVRDRGADPIGLANDYAANLEKQEQEFLNSIPENLREDYVLRLAKDREGRVTSAFRAEIEAMDVKDTQNLEQSLSVLGSALHGGGVALEDALAHWESQVHETGLPSAEKQELVTRGQAVLQGADFGTIMTTAMRGFGAVNDGTTGDVAASGLTPGSRGVLNAIASVESPGYDVWNGGQRFEGYADHPAEFGKAPGESTAAGRYQFILGTWRAAKKSFESTYGVNVPDFSPEWQDRVALHWAEVIFNRHNKEGLNFQQVIASNDPEQLIKVRRVLGNPKDPDNPNSVEWEGWSDRAFGGDAAAADAAFLSIFLGETGVGGGGTGAPDLPDPWTDPRYSMLSLDEKGRLADNAYRVGEAHKKKVADELKAREKELGQQAYQLGYGTGDINLLDELRQQDGWTEETERRFRSGVDANTKRLSTIGEVQAKLTAGLPINKQDMAALGTWFGDEGYAGVASGDEDQYERLAAIAMQTGKLPPNLVDPFRRAMVNPETAPWAAEFFGSLHRGSPGILQEAGFTAKDVAGVESFLAIAQYTSPEKAKERWDMLQGQQSITGKNADQLMREGAKLWAKSAGSEGVMKGVAWDVLSRRPFTTTQRSPIISDVARAQLDREAAEAFQMGYAIFGNEDDAFNYATEAVRSTWGVSFSYAGNNRAFGDRFTPVFMKHPPENSYAPGGDDYAYLYTAADEMIREHEVAGAEVTKGSVRLVPDAQTDREVRDGTPPTYRLVAELDSGELVSIPERFGGPELYAMGTEEAETTLMRRSVQAEHGSMQLNFTEAASKLAATHEEAEGREEAVLVLRTLEDRLLRLEEEGVREGVFDREATNRAVAARERLWAGNFSPEAKRGPEGVSAFVDGANLYLEAIGDGDVERAEALLAPVQSALAQITMTMPEEEGARELWGRTTTVEALANGLPLPELALNRTLFTMTPEIMPGEIRQASHELYLRYNERMQQAQREARRNGDVADEAEMSHDILAGVLMDWAGYMPEEANTLASSIIAEGAF